MMHKIKHDDLHLGTVSVQKDFYFNKQSDHISGLKPLTDLDIYKLKQESTRLDLKPLRNTNTELLNLKTHITSHWYWLYIIFIF